MVLKEKTFEFARDVVRTYKKILSTHNEFVLSRQFLKSGTAPGALVREAEYAQSKPDFISKLSIALKEANECGYWIDLLRDGGFISDSDSGELVAANKEIIYMLVASIKTSKANNQK
jgi:four helix bundle protein